MKVYITCPVSHSKERLDLLPEIAKVVSENDLTPFVFTIGGDPKDIFKRDHDDIRSSGMIIAEVSEPSHGVGIEIGLAYSFGLKIILLLEKGRYVTKLAQGIPDVSIIEYENIEDLRTRLSDKLKGLFLDKRK